MVADSLASGELVEVLPGQRMDSPLAYWLIVGARSAARPEIRAFCDKEGLPCPPMAPSTGGRSKAQPEPAEDQGALRPQRRVGHQQPP